MTLIWSILELELFMYQNQIQTENKTLILKKNHQEDKNENLTRFYTNKFSNYVFFLNYYLILVFIWLNCTCSLSCISTLVINGFWASRSKILSQMIIFIYKQMVMTRIFCTLQATEDQKNFPWLLKITNYPSHLSFVAMHFKTKGLCNKRSRSSSLWL